MEISSTLEEELLNNSNSTTPRRRKLGEKISNENELKINYSSKESHELVEAKSFEEEEEIEKESSSVAASNSSVGRLRKLSDSVINKFGSLWGRTTTQI